MTESFSFSLKETRLNSLLEQIFHLRITETTSEFPLAAEASEALKSENEELLSFANVEIVIESHGGQLMRRGLSQLQWMAECYRRCREEHFQSTVPLTRLWKSACTSNGNIAEECKKVQDILINFGTLSLTCPELFRVETASDADVTLNIINVSESVPSFFSGIVQKMEEDFSEDLDTVFAPVISNTTIQLKHRTLREPCRKALSRLLGLSNFKTLSPIIAKDKMFMPAFGPTPFRSASQGWHLQSESLLGHMLAPTPMDWGVVPADQSCRLMYFDHMSTRTLASLQQSQRTVGKELDAVDEATTQLMKNLSKHLDSRRRLFDWLNAILDASEDRATIAGEQLANMFAAFRDMQTLALRTRGICTSGFALNLMRTLLSLCEPIHLNKIISLDPLLLLRNDEPANRVLGTWQQTPPLGDEEELQTARTFYSATTTDEACPFKGHEMSETKFITEIFYVTIRGARVLMKPSMQEYEALCKRLQGLRSESRTSNFVSSDLESAMAEYCQWDSVITNPNFISRWWNFMNLFCRWVLLWACADVEGKVPPNFLQMSCAQQISVALSNSESGPQFCALPSSALEDVMDSCCLLLQMHSAEEIVNLDSECLLGFAVFVAASPRLRRLPHIKWSAGNRLLLALHYHEILKDRVWSSEISMTYIVSCTVTAFIEAQKASYYARIEQMLLLTKLLESLLVSEKHIAVFADLPRKDPETFTRFIHLFVGHLSWLLDEATSALAEIKKRGNETSPTNTASREPTPEDDEAMDVPISEDGGAARSVANISFAELEQLCKSLMDGGCRSMNLLGLISKHASKAICGTQILLTETVESLNCCLDHLVGEKCLALKVHNFEKYNFRPRELLARIVGIYIRLSEAEDATLIKAICNEGRYFKPKIFTKAHAIAKREGLLDCRESETFLALSSRLNEATVKQKEEDEFFADVPEEYLDPIMQEVMDDPVRLPTSKVIMDRKYIQRHLMSEEFDPFNRMPLTMDAIEELPELKLEIQNYIQRKREEKK